MNKIFALSYRRLLVRLGVQELKVSQIQEVLERNGVSSSKEGFLYRLPREELKHILNIPCPINSLEGEDNQMIVNSSKMLRHHGRIKQEKVCFKCQFKDKCASAKKSYEGQVEDTPRHLLIYWYALANYFKPDDIYFRQWTSAYKLGDSFIAAINDLADGGKQIEEYDSLRIQAAKKYGERDEEGEEKVKDNSKGKKNKYQNDVQGYEKMAQQISMVTAKGARGPRRGDDGEERKVQDREVFGRDYSFEQAEEFQPVAPFTKESYGQESRFVKSKPLDKQKGYQSIQRSEQRSQRPARSEPYQKKYENRSFDRNQRYQKPQEQRYQRNQEQRYERKPDQRFERNYDRKFDRNSESRNEKPSYQRYDKQQDQRYQRNPDQRYQKRPDQRYERNQQKRYEGYQDQRYERRQDHRYERKQDQRYREQKTNEPRQYKPYNTRNSSNYEQDGQYQSKSYQKRQYDPRKQKQGSPFISKWESGTKKPYERSSASQSYQKPSRGGSEDFTLTRPKSESKAYKDSKSTPRIVEIEEIEQMGQSPESSGRGGRSIRRRGRTSSNE